MAEEEEREPVHRRRPAVYIRPTRPAGPRMPEPRPREPEPRPPRPIPTRKRVRGRQPRRRDEERRERPTEYEFKGEPGLLPPWPDELLVGEKKETAISWLRGKMLPSRIASRLLSAWGRYTGTELTRRDYVAIRRDLPAVPYGS